MDPISIGLTGQAAADEVAILTSLLAKVDPAASAFSSLLDVLHVTPQEVVTTAGAATEYFAAFPPPPPCANQCTQLLNGLSNNDKDICIHFGITALGDLNLEDVKCYPYGYNRCDAGMTHCNQQLCASKDKKSPKCQKKLIRKGKITKCNKKKWLKKCAKTCCEAGY